MRHARPLVLALLASACAHAAPASGPAPASATAREPYEAAAASLVDVERQFADAAARVGVRDAFLQFADDSAIAFAPEPASVKAVWLARPRTSIRLTWHPTYSLLSASRDLGFNTGPYEIADSTGAPLGWGTFMTVWHRTPRGWRFVADQGITHARPAAASAPTVVPGHGPPAAAPPAGAPAAVVASVLAADSGFDAMAARAGFRGALEAAGDAEMRWLRPRAEPYVGLPAALAAATADSARRYSATPMRGYASAAGDLGWTWGEYQYVHPGAGRRESGHYVRVWRRDGDMRWRVLLDVDSPRPSERDE